jgi:hypothetical protein
LASARPAFEGSLSPGARETRAALPRRSYQYRGSAKPVTETARAAELLGLLEQQRRLIALKASRLRAATALLYEAVAQAVCDGAGTAPVARASSLPVATVRGFGALRDELDPSGTSVAEHLAALTALADDVFAAESARTAVELARARVVAAARKLQILDDYQLASACGLKHEEIRELTRGVAAGPAA